jgi:hypothetical protein
MNFAHIDDKDAAVKRAHRAIQALKSDITSVEIEKDLSQQITSFSSFKSFVANLNELTGGLILSVDRGLDFDSDRELAGKYDIPEQIWPPDTRRSEEGLAVALAAIQATNISHLLIVLSSGQESPRDVLDFLKERIALAGRAESACVEVMEGNWHFNYKVDDTESPRLMVLWAIRKYRACFPVADSPFARFLDDIETMNPYRLEGTEGTEGNIKGHEHARENWHKLTQELLQLTQKEMTQHFSHFDRFAEVYKELGFCPDLSVSTASAWITALAAYRHLHPTAIWTSIFNPADLTNDTQIPQMVCNDSLNLMSILPRQRKSTLRSSVQALYTMFSFMMQRDEKHVQKGNQECGPLLKVALQPGRLTLEFGFPLKTVGQNGKLADLLSKRLRNVLEAKQGNHGTTEAVFRFLILSMIADETNVECYLFPGDCLRMSLRPGQNSQSTILQFAREHGSLP